MRSADTRLLREFPVSDTSTVELSLELLDALKFDIIRRRRFNRAGGSELDLSIGAYAEPNPWLRRPGADGGSHDRDNARVSGCRPFHVQIGFRGHASRRSAVPM